MSCPVKFFHDGQPGAPVINGTAGSRLAAVRACLVTGWGAVSVTSIVVAGGIATATCSAAHGFDVDSVALISGSATPALNGEFAVLTAPSGSFTFAAPAVSDGTYSGGSVTAKVAPAGWGESFAVGNKAVFRPAGPDGTRYSWRIDDSAATYASVRGYLSMSDVDTGIEPLPTSVQAPLVTIPGSNAETAAGRKWMIIADDRYCIVLVAYNSSYPNDYEHVAFGDFVSYRIPDNYNAVVIGMEGNTSGNSSPGTNIGNARSNYGTWVARKYTQLGGPVKTVRAAHYLSSSGYVSGSQYYSPGPSPVDSVIYLSPVFLLGEETAAHGVVPGLYFVPQYLGSAFDSKTRLDSPVGLPGRRLVAFRTNGYVDVSGSGRMFIDITGPWR